MLFQTAFVNYADPLVQLESKLSICLKNASYKNIEDLYVHFMSNLQYKNTEIFKKAHQFLIPYLIAKTALMDYNKSIADPYFFTKKYGVYTKKSNGNQNDCFTYLQKVFSQCINLSNHDAPADKLEFVYFQADEIKMPIENFEYENQLVNQPYFLNLKISNKDLRSKTIHLQVGDFIMTQKSTHSTINNHWGIIVGSGDVYVVDRAGGTSGLMSLDEFMRNNSDGYIQIRRFRGYTGYDQHFRVSAKEDKKTKKLHFDCKLVSEPEPKNMQPTQMQSNDKKSEIIHSVPTKTIYNRQITIDHGI